MLKQQIEDQLKQALKNGDRFLLETIRFLLAAVKNAEINLKREATDEDVVAAVQKQVKQRREAIEAYQKGGRPDLEEKEKKELEILTKFLPSQLTEQDLKKVTEEVVSNLPEGEERNFGKVMGLVMARVKGKADGNAVSKAVREALSS